MKSKILRVGKFGAKAPILLLPPNVQAMGDSQFTAHDFAKLDGWLAEPGWPAEHMDVAMLEGYLVALLVWPIELAPGAWLPPIWGIRGWKVAAKIATPEKYDEFIALIVGFLNALDRRLADAPCRTFVLTDNLPSLSPQYFAGAAWATGFMMALHFNSGGLGSRSAPAREAVEGIAQFASLRSVEASALARIAVRLGVAVSALAAERASRGPLGQLPRSEDAELRVRAAVLRKLAPVKGAAAPVKLSDAYTLA